MRIAVIDGQGGGIGKMLVEKLRAELGGSVSLIALGTNAVVTSLMLKAGADEGASGENAIVFNAPKVDVIMGSVAVISANSMLGEISPGMAAAVSSSPAKKVLLPLNRCGLYIVGTRHDPLQQYIAESITLVKTFMEEQRLIF